jgi:hypothetical protein
MERPDTEMQGISMLPANPDEFDADDRISFSKLDNKFLLVQDDGTEFEWDDAIKRWIPLLDEALLEEQQRAYAMHGVDESEPVEAQRKKRKKEYVNGDDVRPIFLRFLTISHLTYIYILTIGIGERKISKGEQENQGSTPTPAEYGSLRDRPPSRRNYRRGSRSLLPQVRCDRRRN